MVTIDLLLLTKTHAEHEVVKQAKDGNSLAVKQLLKIFI